MLYISKIREETRAGRSSRLCPARAGLFPAVFSRVLLSSLVLNDPGNGAPAPSLERPFGSLKGFAFCKLFLNVQPTFSFAQFHLITAVTQLSHTTNKPSLSPPRFLFPYECKCLLYPSQPLSGHRMFATVLKNFSSSSFHICDSPLSCALFD